jgi:NTE family protein
MDVVLGDNFRYNFGYYIENGYNLSFGFKSILINSIKTWREISTLDFDVWGNSINVDFQM